MSQNSHSTNRRVVLIAFVISAVLFVIYNLNFRHGNGVDTIGSTLLPVSILREGNLDLEEFRDLLNNQLGTLNGGMVFGTLMEQDGHLMNSYPPGTGIMALPVFAVALATGSLNSWHDYRVTAKIAASLMVALSCGFLFLTLRTWLSEGPSLFLTLLYGLGSSAWPVASQDLWQHPPGMLCLTIGIYCLVLMDRAPLIRHAIIMGCSFAMAIVVRNQNIFPVAAFSLYMLIRQRRFLLYYLAPLVVIGGVTALYNLLTFGKLSGAYAAVYTSQWHGWRGLTPETSFAYPFWRGLASILIAPSKGVLIYSPFMVFALAALFMYRSLLRHPLGPYLVLWVLLMLYTLSRSVLWWGGAAFGARYFSEVAIAFTMLIGIIWPELKQRRWALVLLAALGACSVLIQALGAYLYPCDWELTPRNADRFPERHWEWSDMQIVRCIHRGCEQGPLPFEILEYQPGDPEF